MGKVMPDSHSKDHPALQLTSTLLGGYFGSRLMKENNPSGIVKNILIGAVGGLLGSLVFSLIGLTSSNWVGDVLISLVGSCLAIWLGRKIQK